MNLLANAPLLTIDNLGFTHPAVPLTIAKEIKRTITR